MKLSVILITWNSREDIRSCLDSVITSTSHLTCQIIVVDNNSQDGSWEILKGYGSQIHLMRNTKNCGVAKARNRALKDAKGDYVWILDIDTIVNSSAVNAMINFLDDNLNAGVCGCKLTSLQGDVQDSCRKVPTLKFKFINAFIAILNKARLFKNFQDQLRILASSQYYHSQINQEKPFEVGYLIGACQMFRHELIVEVGFLDENIFYGPEDADFCVRIKQTGNRVMYIPNVSIIHHYMRITNKKIISRMSFIHLKALLYFAWKHRHYVQ